MNQDGAIRASQFRLVEATLDLTTLTPQHWTGLTLIAAVSSPPAEVRTRAAAVRIEEVVLVRKGAPVSALDRKEPEQTEAPLLLRRTGDSSVTRGGAQ
jgi:hypothetical protein